MRACWCRSTAEDGSGCLVPIDAGRNAFAWRLAGIIFGSVLVGIIYLFTATLFAAAGSPCWRACS